MSERAPLPEVLQRPAPGRVLLLAPHADDDVLGAGGVCALHAAQGDPVHVVVVYNGLAGDPDGHYEPEAYRDLRQREARAGGVHLGLSDYEFWDYPEGHEPGDGEFVTGVQRLEALVRSFEPTQVYAPWVGEHHIDHHVLARVAQVALELAGFRGEAWGYEVWTPLVATRIVDISSVFEAKARALEEHQSQLRYRETGHYLLGINANRAMYLEDGRYGEGFRPLGPATDADRALLGLAPRTAPKSASG